MTFDVQTEEVHKIELAETQNGSLTSSLEYAKPGETVEFGVKPDFGCSITKVSYTYLKFDSSTDNYYNVDPIEIEPVDGVYKLTIPDDLPDTATVLTVSAEIKKNYGVYISDKIINGTVTVDNQTPPENTAVTLTVKPKEGYHLDKITVKKMVQGAETEIVTVGSDNKKDIKLQNVCKALYLYWKAADRYFKEVNN